MTERADARRRAATERVQRPSLPAAPKPPLDPEQDRIKQERLEKIRKQQAEKKEALLRARALKVEEAKKKRGSAAAEEEGQTEEASEILSEKASSPRGRSATATSSLRRGVSAGTVVRAAGRGKSPGSRSPRGAVSPRASDDLSSKSPRGIRSSHDAKRMSTGGSGVEERIRPSSSQRSRAVSLGKSSGDRVAKELAAEAVEIPQERPPAPTEPRTAPDNRPPLPKANPPPNLPTEPKAQEEDAAAAAGGGGGGWGISWGALADVATSITTTLGNKADQLSPRPNVPPPSVSPHRPTVAAPSRESLDSLTTLEEMLEMQESIDALRLMVAQQGSQIRAQGTLIEELQEKVAWLEGKK